MVDTFRESWTECNPYVLSHLRNLLKVHASIYSFAFILKGIHDVSTMDAKELNEYIDHQYDPVYDVDASIDMLLQESSVVKKITNLFDTLKSVGVSVSSEQQMHVVRKHPELFVNGQIKANRNGENLNRIVYELLVNELGPEFEITRETKHQKADERVDILVEHLPTNTEFIIMNQVDLWSGGAQNNRKNHYMAKRDTAKTKYIFVVSRYKQFSKGVPHLLDGFKRRNVCYPSVLVTIIREHIKKMSR